MYEIKSYQGFGEIKFGDESAVIEKFMKIKPSKFKKSPYDISETDAYEDFFVYYDKDGNYLGKGLAAIAAVVNPEAFVIGGGVSKAGTIILDYIKKNYDDMAFRGCKNAEFCLATLGNDAGIYGAAKLVLE